MNKIYEIYSLIVGLSAILTFIYFFTINMFFGVEYCIFEPIWIISILEYLIGLSVLPYYFKRFLEINKK